MKIENRFLILLPKLRSHFAEFLSYSSLAHLRILSSPMCVHFRYGLSAVLLEAFLGSRLWPLLYLSQCSIRVTPSGYAIRICLDDPYLACSSSSSRWLAQPSPSLLHPQPGTGMSTRCPSATPLGLALGPDLPRADEPSSGNLGHLCFLPF